MAKILIVLLVLLLPLWYFLSPKTQLKNPASVKPIQNTFINFSTPTPTPEPKAYIGLVGDLGLGRHITSTARSKNDFSWSFKGVSPWLAQNDFTLANLESPVITNCPEGKTGTFTFCGDTRFLPYLVDNKFIFNLANNHIFNYGQKGFTETISLLSQNNIKFVYSHDSKTEFARQDINGISFGFLGFDFVTNPKLNSDTIISTVKKYDPTVDWLIISLHWGNEYLPSAEKWRVNLAHSLVDSGADIIHGHHPHVWQPDETYQGKPIFYSLGNFIFDQSWSYETSHTNIVRLNVTKSNLISTQKFPVEIKYNSQPWLSQP